MSDMIFSVQRKHSSHVGYASKYHRITSLFKPLPFAQHWGNRRTTSVQDDATSYKSYQAVFPNEDVTVLEFVSNRCSCIDSDKQKPSEQEQEQQTQPGQICGRRPL